MVEMTTRTPEPWLDGSARRSEAPRRRPKGSLPVPGSICPRLLPRTGVAASRERHACPLMRWRRILALRHPTPDAPCAARHCRPDQWRGTRRAVRPEREACGPATRYRQGFGSRAVRHPARHHASDVSIENLQVQRPVRHGDRASELVGVFLPSARGASGGNLGGAFVNDLDAANGASIQGRVDHVTGAKATIDGILRNPTTGYEGDEDGFDNSEGIIAKDRGVRQNLSGRQNDWEAWVGHSL